MPQIKVTEGFFVPSPKGDRTAAGDRKVTEEKIVLSPGKYMKNITFYPIGDRVTDKIQTTIYTEKEGKRAKTGIEGRQKHNPQQNAFFCHSVTPAAFHEVSA